MYPLVYIILDKYSTQKDIFKKISGKKQYFPLPAVVYPAVIRDDAHSNGAGNLLLICGIRKFFFFSGVGNESHFKKDPRHIEVSQYCKSAPADASVMSFCPEQHGSLHLKGKQKVVAVKSIALEGGVGDLFLVGG